MGHRKSKCENQIITLQPEVFLRYWWGAAEGRSPLENYGYEADFIENSTYKRIVKGGKLICNFEFLTETLGNTFFIFKAYTGFGFRTFETEHTSNYIADTPLNNKNNNRFENTTFAVSVHWGITVGIGF